MWKLIKYVCFAIGAFFILDVVSDILTDESTTTTTTGNEEISDATDDDDNNRRRERRDKRDKRDKRDRRDKRDKEVIDDHDKDYGDDEETDDNDDYQYDDNSYDDEDDDDKGGSSDNDDDDNSTDEIGNTPIGNDNNDDVVPVKASWGDGTLKAISSSQFNTLVANTKGDYETFIGKGPVVVTFWADASDYCSQLNNKLEAKAKTYKGKIQFYKINVDDNSDIYEKYELESIPTTFFCVDGDIKILTGLPTDAILETRLNDLLK